MFRIIIVVFCLVQFGNGWVFTDIRIPARGDGYGEELEGDMTPEEYDEMLRQARFSLIFPGTKWCGPGNSADGFEDLGSERETDACCREHDHCPDSMEAGEKKHNLTNTAYYTRLHCDCDERFQRCLHSANTTSAGQVGSVYFNVIGTKCYRYDYPIVRCAKKSGWLRRKCIKYEFNENGQKLYQWFDVPNY
ncbi:phospholipase A2 isoform X1 [Plutella xylostella]|uniref:phospholipase A2 isoform X1 n=2 Tax=Plutella xylostella TaxID=51655 RepID=UPI002032F943|nr:phospholipase A2 isoform X1 [Plutella xylostella]